MDGPRETGDPFDNLEEIYAREQESKGYTSGLELGRRDGQTEGYTIGFEEGAKRGAELGYFNGYTVTYKQLVNEYKKSEDHNQTMMKTIKKYNDILELIDKFPRTNEIDCEEKLSTIRAKFKQAFACNKVTTTSTTTNNQTTYPNQENILIKLRDQRRDK